MLKNSFLENLRESIINYKFIPDSQLKLIPEGTKNILREEGRKKVLYPFFDKIIDGIEFPQETKYFNRRVINLSTKDTPYLNVILKFFNQEYDSIITSIIKNKTINKRISDEVLFYSIIRYCNERDLYKNALKLNLISTRADFNLEERLLLFKTETEMTQEDFTIIKGYNNALLLPKYFIEKYSEINFNQYYYQLQSMISNLDERISSESLKLFYDLTSTYKLKDLTEKIEKTEIFKVDKKARKSIESLRIGTIRDINSAVGYQEMMTFFDELDKANFYTLNGNEQLVVLNDLIPLLMQGYEKSTITKEIRSAYNRGIEQRKILHNEVLSRNGSR